MIGFAGARVIEQTVREKLPEGFQRAEYLLEHGILDMVVKRGEMRATLARVIGLLRVPVVLREPEPRRDGRDRAAGARRPAPAEAPPPARPETALSRAEAIVERLHALHPKLIDLSLGRMQRCAGGAGPTRSGGCRRWCMWPAPTARAAPAPSCAPSPKPRGCARMSSPPRIWCISTSACAWPARWSTDADADRRAGGSRAANAGEPITVFEITTAARCCCSAACRRI